MSEPASVRFWRKVEQTDTCWLWRGAVGSGGRVGYGVFHAYGRKVMAHRFAYELCAGPIPDGLVIDHRCGVTLCVNPAHLEPVTVNVNGRRGRHCDVLAATPAPQLRLPL